MDNTFAKLFDFTSYQVLVTSETDDETDAPQILIRTNHAGLVLTTRINFERSANGDAKRDRLFQSASAEWVKGLRATLLESLNLQPSEG
jgi:hypothetical protein